MAEGSAEKEGEGAPMPLLSSPIIEMEVSTFLILFLSSSVPTLLFVLGYSGMGYGLDVTAKSYEYHDEAAQIVIAILVLSSVLYTFDADRWPRYLQVPCCLILFVGLCAVLLLMVTETPYGPLCVLVASVPLLLIGVKKIGYKGAPPDAYASWICAVLVVQGLVLIAGFFVWATRGENMWDAPTRAYFSDRAGCTIDYDGDLEYCADASTPGDVPCFWESEEKSGEKDVKFSSECTVQCLGVYEACEEAFIIWSNPFLAAMALVVMGFIAIYFKPNDPDARHGLLAVLRFFAIFLFLFWVSASLAGAGDGLSSSLIAYAIAMCVGNCMVMAALFWKTLKTGNTVEGAVSRAESYLDVLKGLVVLLFAPLLIPYLLLSSLNQVMRRIITFRFHCITLTEEERLHRGCLTKRVTEQLQEFKTWDHSRILSYAVYWGAGYVFLNVLAAKLTTVFLSWLIDATDKMDIPTVTWILIGVGLALFLLPPIPGLPVYLTAGIILVSVGRTTMGLAWSMGYACLVSQFLKLLACAVQMKIIGAQLGGSVSIRQAVGINSDGVRAMRVILSDKSMTARKVAVLVGGPDWPVSVLCGMMGLDMLPVLVGTIPVAILIVPTVLCGSFAYMGSLEGDDGLDLYPWADTMGAVASAVTAAAMFYAALSAAGAVKSTLKNDKSEIDTIPMDDEVAQADAAATKRADAYKQAVAWSNVPVHIKLSLMLSVLSMIGCVYLLLIFNSQCFREYDLMYTIKENLGGNWQNIVLPLGWWALGFFTLSCLMLFGVFEAWAKRETEKYLDEMQFHSSLNDGGYLPPPV